MQHIMFTRHPVLLAYNQYGTFCSETCALLTTLSLKQTSAPWSTSRLMSGMSPFEAASLKRCKEHQRKRVATWIRFCYTRLQHRWKESERRSSVIGCVSKTSVGGNTSALVFAVPQLAKLPLVCVCVCVFDSVGASSSFIFLGSCTLLQPSA